MRQLVGGQLAIGCAMKACDAVSAREVIRHRLTRGEAPLECRGGIVPEYWLDVRWNRNEHARIVGKRVDDANVPVVNGGGAHRGARP